MIFLDFPFRKTKMSRLLLSPVVSTFVSCSASTPEAMQATIVFEGGRIWTSDPKQPWADPLAVFLEGAMN